MREKDENKKIISVINYMQPPIYNRPQIGSGLDIVTVNSACFYNITNTINNHKIILCSKFQNTVLRCFTDNKKKIQANIAANK